jgi:hypothetical protein
MGQKLATAEIKTRVSVAKSQNQNPVERPALSANTLPNREKLERNERDQS